MSVFFALISAKIPISQNPISQNPISQNPISQNPASHITSKTMQSQKHLFSLRKDAHYLNCAYRAPLLKATEMAAVHALHRDRNPMDLVPIKVLSTYTMTSTEFPQEVFAS